MRRKRYRKHITYDSQETKTVIGLLIVFAGALALLSYFLEGGAFVFIRSLFNEGTLVLAIFCFSLSLRMFGSEFPLASTRSLIGQALFLIFYSAYRSSIFDGSGATIGDQTIYGGIIGNFVFNFLRQNVFLNFTPIFIFLMIILSIPLALTMSIDQFLDKIGAAIQWLMSKVIPKPRETMMGQEPVQPNVQASTYSDFQKNTDPNLLQKPNPKMPENKNAGAQTQFKDGEIDEKNVSALAYKQGSQPKVQVKEKTDSEGPYINEELLYPNWKFPPISLLNPYKKTGHSQEDISKNADIIEQTLNSFGVKAKVVDVLIGPAVTQYALDIALGTKVSKISNLANDLALALATPASSVRIEAPIPGTSYVGIEIPNHERETVYLKEVIQNEQMKNHKFLLPLGIGKDINGQVVVVDLQRMPHILIAGATGSGKSILTNGFILSLLMNRTPDQVKFIMVDPKQVELSDYNGIPHLLTPVITEMDKVVNALKWAIAEMESRYTLFRNSKVKNIEGYNEFMGYPALPYILIVIDEMADMMMSTNRVDSEAAIVRLAQKARATGIHLILATQRPSVDVLTGLIKANITGRIGMSVTTQIDSRVIIDHIGAETLLGRGDMLYKDPAKIRPVRLQGLWVSPDEIQRVVQYIKEQVDEVEYSTKITAAPKSHLTEGVAGGAYSDDNLFANAVKVIVNARKGSASLLQRKLSVGYNRAARLLDELEEHGVVGPANGSKPRDVLIGDAETFLAARAGNKSEVGSPDDSAAYPEEPVQ